MRQIKNATSQIKKGTSKSRAGQAMLVCAIVAESAPSPQNRAHGRLRGSIRMCASTQLRESLRASSSRALGRLWRNSFAD